MAILHQQKKWTHTQTNMLVTYKMISLCLLSLEVNIQEARCGFFFKVSYIPPIIVKYSFLHSL